MTYNNHIPLSTQEPKTKATIVVVPFPAQGHLNQLLHLSRLLSSYATIPLHFVGTATHNKQAKLRIHGWHHLSSVTNIHFHQFPTPSFLSPPPNPNASVKFPAHLQPSFEASFHLRQPVAALLHSLSQTTNRLVVIHDSLMSSVVQDVGLIPNAEAYTFHSVSGFTILLHLWETNGRPFELLQPEIMKDVPSFEGCFTSEFVELISSQYDCMRFNSGRIYNTSKVMEKPYLDLLARQEISKNKKQWALGPFNPVAIPSNTEYVNRHACLEWLDKQAPNSVIFISFGTTTSMSDEQITEIALGLERSEQKFIWVLRDADRGDVFEGEVRRAELPKGYEERMEGRLMVVRDWAPQLEILAHRSTGGFMSHCGWNSCMESITMGVPILAWPMHSDQPRNAMLICKLLKLGLQLKDWARRDELITAGTVELVVKRLMNSKEGGEIRRRVAEMGGAVRSSVAEGGVSQMELDSFINHITRA